MTLFNPLDSFYKNIIGSISESEQVTFRVKGNFDSVVFVFKRDGEEEIYYPMQKDDDCFFITKQLSVGLYFYCFKVNDNLYVGKGENLEGVLTDKPDFYQLSVYSNNFFTPDFIKGGVIYQIFPDRFCNFNNNSKVNEWQVMHSNWGEMPIFEPDKNGKVLNNDFFGGNLKGITFKLDYLKALGVTTIYLNPIFKAYSNHRYDTGDYMAIDNLLGDENDLIELINIADSKGISIILDGVFNHTGDDSLYFNKYGRYDSVGAYQSKHSKYYNWFRFSKFPNEYESWWGISTLPQVNEDNPDFIEFITGKDGVLERYTKLGVKGWRLDVVDELPGFFVKRIRNAVKKIDKNAIVIGEVWEDASNKISYGERREYFLGEELDSVMNYPLKNAIINYVKNKDERELNRVILEQLDHYPKQVINSLMNILATHDTYRLISALSSINTTNMTKKQMSCIKLDENEYIDAKFKVKVASLLQYTLYGVPSLYYGDEIGMQGFIDPLNRGCMEWDNGDTDLLDWFIRLGKLRSEFDCFIGDFELVFAKNGGICYKRIGKTSEIFIAVNLSNRDLMLDFEGQLVDYLSSAIFNNEVVIKSCDYKILISKKVK